MLAEDIKYQLRMSDADLGFLYGTAFAVFYALFGIPMGGLADNVRRTSLLAAGLAVWSFMTTVCGFANSGAQLASARIGVGIGEATSAPTAYSLLSDYFPKSHRATALALYATGLYVGAGASLFLGGLIDGQWNAAYPAGGPLGLVGWQAAFLAVGVPGLLLSAWVATLREPARGGSEGAAHEAPSGGFCTFFKEAMSVIPPLTLIDAARSGPGTLAINLIAGLLAASTAFALAVATGDRAQWGAVGVGTYAIFSWAMSLQRRDAPAFRLIWGCPAFMLVVVGFAFIAWVSYSFAFWSIPYAGRRFHVPLANAGLIIGGTSAVSGLLGTVAGGRIADFLRRRDLAGRLLVALFAAIAPIPLIWASFTTSALPLIYALQFPITATISMALGACAATTQDLVVPRVRGIATATFYTGLTMIGLALGPYSVGRISQWSGSLAFGALSILGAAPVAAVALVGAYRLLPGAERTVEARACAAGEPT